MIRYKITNGRLKRLRFLTTIYDFISTIVVFTQNLYNFITKPTPVVENLKLQVREADSRYLLL